LKKSIHFILFILDRWFVNFSKSEIKNLIKELHGEGEANLTSDTLTVR